MRYIGSKKKLLSFIDEKITEVTKNDIKQIKDMVFVDLFAGTGIVGEYFFKKGYNVIGNDMQYYSYVLTKCLLCDRNNFQFDNLKEYLKVDFLDESIVFEHLNNLSLKKGFIYKNYSINEENNCERSYFTNFNAQKFDSIRIEIEEWKNKKLINEDFYFYLLGSLINSMGNCSNTAGQYDGYLKSFNQRSSKNFKLEPYVNILEYNKLGENVIVYNENSNDLIKKISGDILYIDIPYNQRQYSDKYHLLETMAKYDCPKIYGKVGKREDSKINKSKYSKKRDALNEFIELINNANFKYIFVSYNNEGIINFEDIQKVLKSKGEYICFEKEHKKYKSCNKETNNNQVIEYLHCVIVNN